MISPDGRRLSLGSSAGIPGEPGTVRVCGGGQRVCGLRQRDLRLAGGWICAAHKGQQLGASHPQDHLKNFGSALLDQDSQHLEFLDEETGVQ